ncbi:hypothetical protein FG05_35378 [Fusarium graminearum]|nr:hypothetical protein FG05_35378 [Fusarium graminearum]
MELKIGLSAKNVKVKGFLIICRKRETVKTARPA